MNWIEKLFKTKNMKRRPKTPIGEVTKGMKNVVFEITESWLPGLVDKNNDTSSFEDRVFLPVGTKLSYLGCKKPSRFALIPFRYGDGDDEIFYTWDSVKVIWGQFGSDPKDLDMSRHEELA